MTEVAQIEAALARLQEHGDKSDPDYYTKFHPGPKGTPDEKAVRAWTGYVDPRYEDYGTWVTDDSGAIRAALRGEGTHEQAERLLQLTAEAPHYDGRLFRGIAVSDESFARLAALRKGETYDMNLSAWTTDFGAAMEYSNPDRGERKTGRNRVIFALLQGAHALSVEGMTPLSWEKEYLTQGRFRVLKNESIPFANPNPYNVMVQSIWLEQIEPFTSSSQMVNITEHGDPDSMSPEEYAEYHPGKEHRQIASHLLALLKARTQQDDRGYLSPPDIGPRTGFPEPYDPNRPHSGDLISHDDYLYWTAATEPRLDAIRKSTIVPGSLGDRLHGAIEASEPTTEQLVRGARYTDAPSFFEGQRLFLPLLSFSAYDIAKNYVSPSALERAGKTLHPALIYLEPGAKAFHISAVTGVGPFADPEWVTMGVFEVVSIGSQDGMPTATIRQVGVQPRRGAGMAEYREHGDPDTDPNYARDFHPGPGGAGKAVHIDEFERKWAKINPKTEAFLIVAPDGTTLQGGMGTKTRATSQHIDVSLLQRGAVLTHFHPDPNYSDEARLSFGDINNALRRGYTIRAFQKNGSWQQFVPKPSPYGTYLDVTEGQLNKKAMAWAEERTADGERVRPYADPTTERDRLLEEYASRKGVFTNGVFVMEHGDKERMSPEEYAQFHPGTTFFDPSDLSKEDQFTDRYHATTAKLKASGLFVEDVPFANLPEAKRKEVAREAQRLADMGWHTQIRGTGVLAPVYQSGTLGRVSSLTQVMQLSPRMMFNGYNAARNAGDIFRHEYGHVIEQSLKDAYQPPDSLNNRLRGVIYEWLDATWATSNLSTITKTLSAYVTQARSDEEYGGTTEALAEAFAILTRPDYVSGSLPFEEKFVALLEEAKDHPLALNADDAEAYYKANPTPYTQKLDKALRDAGMKEHGSKDDPNYYKYHPNSPGRGIESERPAVVRSTLERLNTLERGTINTTPEWGPWEPDLKQKGRWEGPPNEVVHFNGKSGTDEFFNGESILYDSEGFAVGAAAWFGPGKSDIAPHGAVVTVNVREKGMGWGTRLYDAITEEHPEFVEAVGQAALSDEGARFVKSWLTRWLEEHAPVAEHGDKSDPNYERDFHPGPHIHGFERQVGGEEFARNPTPGRGVMYGPERGMIVDTEGNVVWSGTGEPTRLTGTDAFMKPGYTLTHFHPGDIALGPAALSHNDLLTAASHNMTIRAFQADGSWEEFTPFERSNGPGIAMRDIYGYAKEEAEKKGTSPMDEFYRLHYEFWSKIGTFRRGGSVAVTEHGNKGDPDYEALYHPGPGGKEARDKLDKFSAAFAAKHKDDPTEWGAILSPTGEVLLDDVHGMSMEEVEANRARAAAAGYPYGIDKDENGFDLTGGAVVFGPDAPRKGNVVIHTHPAQQGPKGDYPLSTGDVRTALAYKAAEIRAEGPTISYRMRPGRVDGLWHDPSIRVGVDMTNYYEAALERISSVPIGPEYQIGGSEYGKRDIVEQWMSDAWVETAKQYGWIYERVERDKSIHAEHGDPHSMSQTEYESRFHPGTGALAHRPVGQNTRPTPSTAQKMSDQPEAPFGDRRPAQRIIDSVHGKPAELVTVYRGEERGTTRIMPGDWVTPNDSYARMYAPGGNVLTMRIPAGELYGDRYSPQEWAWWPEGFREHGDPDRDPNYARDFHPGPGALDKNESIATFYGFGGNPYSLRRGGAEREEDMRRWVAAGEGLGVWEQYAVAGQDDMALNAMQSAWAQAPDSFEANLMKAAVAAAGLGSGSPGYGPQAGETSIRLVKAMYERTQARLADGPATYRLYRGLMPGEDDRLRIRKGTLEAWSMDPAVAIRFARFGGRVYTAEVPREAIFMVLTGGHGFGLHEDEMVVIGSKRGPARVTVREHGDPKRMPREEYLKLHPGSSEPGYPPDPLPEKGGLPEAVRLANWQTTSSPEEVSHLGARSAANNPAILKRWQSSAVEWGLPADGPPGDGIFARHERWVGGMLYDDNGDPVASVQIAGWPTFLKVPFVTNVLVRPDARGKGWGSRLYDFMQDHTPVNMYDIIGQSHSFTAEGKPFALAWLRHRAELEGVTLPKLQPPPPQPVHAYVHESDAKSGLLDAYLRVLDAPVKDDGTETDPESELREHGNKGDPNYWRYHPMGVESIKVKVVDSVPGAVARYVHEDDAIQLTKNETDPHTFAHEVGHRWESNFDQQLVEPEFTAGLGHFDPEQHKFIVGTNRYGLFVQSTGETTWYDTMEEQNAAASALPLGGWQRKWIDARKYRNPSEAAADTFAYYVHRPDLLSPTETAWVENLLTGDWPAVVEALRAHPNPQEWIDVEPLKEHGDPDSMSREEYEAKFHPGPAGQMTDADRGQVLGYVNSSTDDAVRRLVPDDPTYFSPREGYGLYRGADYRMNQLETLPDIGDDDEGSYELAMKRGHEVEAIEYVQWDWQDAVTSPASALVQSSVAAEFGAHGMIWSAGQPLLEVSDYSKQAVRAAYDETQRVLKNRGVETLTVYRGIGLETGVRNVLESWTTDRTIAEMFAVQRRPPNVSGGVYRQVGYILTATIPASAIFLAPVYDGENLREREVVAIGDRIESLTAEEVSADITVP